MEKNQIITLEITGMTNEGNGVGRYDNIAVFVPMTAIGDKLEVKIVKVLKSYCFGIVEKIISPSKSRQKSDCPVFKQCGGCSFRHINYQEELEMKSNFVKDAFERIGNISPEFMEICGSENVDFYRNKAQYPVFGVKGDIKCGFYAKRSHRVVPFSACKLQPKIFESIVNFVIEKVNNAMIEPYDENSRSGILRHIYIRQAFHTKEIMLCFVVTKLCKKLFFDIAKSVAEEFPDIKSVVLNINSKDTNVILGEKCEIIFGKDTITDTMCDNLIEISPLSFYQVNTPQAEALYSKARNFANLSKDDFLLDLYCGAGTISLFMAKNICEVLGVEIIPQAVLNAQKNAQINNINNAKFICKDAQEAVLHLKENDLKPDVVVVDPPRKGCSLVTLNSIADMSPNRIVMVSCNPATAARDCAVLENLGYKINKCQAFDLFPRTTHVETVVLMSRKEK